MFKLPTLAEICGAVKYSYEHAGIDGISLLLKDGRAFTAWENGEVEVPHIWNVPHNTMDLDGAIKDFIEYHKGERYAAYKELLSYSKETEVCRVILGRKMSDLDFLEGIYGFSEIKKTINLLEAQRGFSGELGGILYREDELRLYGEWENFFSQILKGETPAYAGYFPDLLRKIHHNIDVNDYPPVLVGKIKSTYDEFKVRWLDL